MLITAVFVPSSLGSNVISKVVVPPAVTEEAGCRVTAKSLLPVMTTGSGLPVRFRASKPKFPIVKVRVIEPPVTGTLPKFVQSAVLGLVSPSTIETPLPRIVISGSGGMTCPVIRKLKGFSSGSFVRSEISPLLVPTVAVSNCTVNVSDSPGARLAGKPSVNV